MQWPPRSGKQQIEFPEIERAEFFDLAMARTKVKVGQESLISQLEKILNSE